MGDFQMVLIQMLLPYASGHDDDSYQRTRDELVAKFGGVTAYSQSPAEGVWAPAGRPPERDTLVMIEIVAEEFDRAWWRSYADTLARRFNEEVIHVRALNVQVLDPAST